jgi:hypothetical protein
MPGLNWKRRWEVSTAVENSSRITHRRHINLEIRIGPIIEPVRSSNSMVQWFDRYELIEPPIR